MRCIGKSVFILLAMSAVGCVQRTLTVTSDPPGALVYANGNEIGRTPLRRDFIWYGTYDVQLREDGYETLDASTPVIAPIWQWPPIDFFAEFWPGHLRDERTIHYKLTPASTEPVDTTLMIARAAELHAKMEYSQYTKEPTTGPSTKPTTKPVARPSE